MWWRNAKSCVKLLKVDSLSSVWKQAIPLKKFGSKTASVCSCICHKIFWNIVQVCDLLVNFGILWVLKSLVFTYIVSDQSIMKSIKSVSIKHVIIEFLCYALWPWSYVIIYQIVKVQNWTSAFYWFYSAETCTFLWMYFALFCSVQESIPV